MYFYDLLVSFLACVIAYQWIAYCVTFGTKIILQVSSFLMCCQFDIMKYIFGEMMVYNSLDTLHRPGNQPCSPIFFTVIESLFLTIDLLIWKGIDYWSEF